MCLIIHRPDNVSLPPEWHQNALVANPDGWGLMGVMAGKIRIVRGLKPPKFAAALASFGKGEIFAHFRYATHGRATIENTHPFSICGGNFAIVHNGMLDVECGNPALSDTWHFANELLAPILTQAPDAILDQGWIAGVSSLVGSTNKIIILRADGEHAILNRSQGFDHQGCWLSNLHSIQAPRTVQFASQWAWDKRDLPSRSSVPVPVQSEESEWDLEAIADMEEEDIAALCLESPEEMARAIRDYFPYSAYRR